MDEIEITVKIINTPNHDFLPMGKSINFLINPNDNFQILYDLIDEKIKEYIIIPDFLTFSLLTYDKKKINIDDKISSIFSTDIILDIIDRNENILNLYFHKFDNLLDNKNKDNKDKKINYELF